jgi:hypothetical protein
VQTEVGERGRFGVSMYRYDATFVFEFVATFSHVASLRTARHLLSPQFPVCA